MDDLTLDDFFDFADDFDPDLLARPRDAAAHYQPDARLRDPDLRWMDQDRDEDL
jgi:hypothetical protein